LLTLARVRSALSLSCGEPTWCGRADKWRMYSRSESGDGIARNLASQSRWTLADSAVKPRRSPVGAGARARSRMPRPQAVIGRALMRIRTEPRGRVVGGGRGGPLLVFQLVPRIHLKIGRATCRERAEIW